MSARRLSRSSPIKRHRRTRAEIATICDGIRNVLEHDNPMTVRQVFSRLISTGEIRKTEAEYKQTVCRLLVDLRREGEIPFGWIADSTRWMRKPRTYSSLESAVKHTAEHYRRAIWDEQEVYVEVWLEKDALAGVLYPITDQWDVPLMVTRGYPSLSYLYAAAEAIADCGKPAFLYYLGDHDPSGLDIPRRVEKDLREFAPDAEIHFKRIAVTKDQIEVYNLPTRPTKQTDSRARNFEGESVEVDAIEPARLRSLVETYIEQHIDTDTLARTKLMEAEESKILDMFPKWAERKRRMA